MVEKQDLHDMNRRLIGLLVARGWGKGNLARRLQVTPGCLTHWLDGSRHPYPATEIMEALLRVLKEPTQPKGIAGRPHKAHSAVQTPSQVVNHPERAATA